MKSMICFLPLAAHFAVLGGQDAEIKTLAKPGETPANRGIAQYVHEKETGLSAAIVKTFSIGWGPVEPTTKGDAQWLWIKATKTGGENFQVWLLTSGYPGKTSKATSEHTARFIVQHRDSVPCEFRHRITGEAVLPVLGGWHYLMPRPSDPEKTFTAAEGFPKRTEYLGHRYRLAAEAESSPPAVPANTRLIELRPDVLFGVPSNTRQKDGTRRYDGSDYAPQRLTRADYHEMAEAGINCLRVDAEQRGWIEDLNVFYWGVGGKDVPYPECLYDSRYLGPTLFLDEPAVHTRDYVIRPRLAKDETFRQSVTPQIVYDAFREYYRHAWQEGAATSLLKGLAARPDVDLGDMQFRQENLFSWETMVSTAAYQLSQDAHVPSAMVFEPPGRVGTLRTLPELNMTYGCQIPVDDPKNFIDIIYGFLRGAARLTGKQWGTSIYGAVDRADAPWFLTHAYDLGATLFFCWDNAAMACVPYQECLGLARILKMRAENHPHRDMNRLQRAAEVAVLFPMGYNLGHVRLGKGSLWGLDELNLERTNANGIKYRAVMGNFFTEIERCLRLGVAFDLLWDLPDSQPSGYREVVRIREDGKVEIMENGKQSVLEHARLPDRPSGIPPTLGVTLSATEGKAPLRITVRAEVAETTAPVYYSLGTDTNGVYHNAMVAWELYGPNEADFNVLRPPRLKPRIVSTGRNFEVTAEIQIDRPGKYRLRASTVDMAGRTTVHWTPIVAME